MPFVKVKTFIVIAMITTAIAAPVAQLDEPAGKILFFCI